MVSQPRALDSAPDPTAAARVSTVSAPSLIAPALQPAQSLPRLLAGFVLTALVVTVWSLRADPTPVAPAPSEANTVLGDTDPAGPTAEIAAPESAPAASSQPMDDLIQGPQMIAPDTAESVDLPRLRPGALPRPPEMPEPIQPGSFIRFIAQPGDTIYDVSIVYGVPIDEILRFNPTLGDGTQIDVGQLIFVPDD